MFSVTQTEYKAMIDVCMGGRVAEGQSRFRTGRIVASRLTVLGSLRSGWLDERCIERSPESHAHRNDDGQGNPDAAYRGVKLQLRHVFR